MNRAVFIGGPIDGQERVLSASLSKITIKDESSDLVVYHRLFAFGDPPVFLYSVWEVSAALLHLWNSYTGGKYADPT